MNIYRYPTHLEVIDGRDLFRIPLTLATCTRVAVVNSRYAPMGGRLVHHPMRKLLFPVIELIKKYRHRVSGNEASGEVARAASSTAAPRISSALVQGKLFQEN